MTRRTTLRLGEGLDYVVRELAGRGRGPSASVPFLERIMDDYFRLILESLPSWPRGTWVAVVTEILRMQIEESRLSPQQILDLAGNGLEEGEAAAAREVAANGPSTARSAAVLAVAHVVKGRMDDERVTRSGVDAVFDDAWQALVGYHDDGEVPPP